MGVSVSLKPTIQWERLKRDKRLKN